MREQPSAKHAPAWSTPGRNATASGPTTTTTTIPWGPLDDITGAVLDAARSDCAQGIGLAVGITVSTVQTGGALVAGGSFVTGSFASTATTRGTIVYISTGGDPLSTGYAVGRYFIEGGSMAMSCVP